MKSLITSALLLLTAMAAQAQTDAPPEPAQAAQEQPAAPPLRFGFLSCDSALHALPGYATAMRDVEDLKAKYDEEMKRVEDEFNQKYELFLEQQASFAPSIRQKRQAELQELMEKNVAFKKEARRMLAEAETEALATLRQTVRAAITRIGQQRGLAFVINTDAGAMPYADTAMGTDITAEVIASIR